MVGNISRHSQSDRSQQGPTCTSERYLFSGSNCRVRVHELVRIHEGEHGIGSGHANAASVKYGLGDLFGDGGVGRQFDEDGAFEMFADPSDDLLYDLGDVGAGTAHAFVGHAVVAGQVEL